MKAFEKLPFKISLFLVLAVIITLLCGLVLGASQQIYRQSANDPQVQISESTAHMLESGEDLTPYLPVQPADISKSLATFIIVYDQSGKATVSTAKLEGVTPNLPAGVLENAKLKGQNRVTWQPKDGVRIASVITPYNKGYVLAGRSLRETETRVKMLTMKVFIAWVVTILAAFISTWLLIPNHKKSS